MLSIFKANEYLSDNFEQQNLRLGKIDIDLRIHRADTNKVLIMYPGADGSIDGYNNKYKKIANWLSENNVATVIRLDNKYCIDELPYIETMITKLAYVIEHVIENQNNLSSNGEIELYLAGVSAGAGAVATVLSDFPQVSRALFIAPHDSIDIDNILRGLKQYSGEVYFVAGEDDEIGTHEKAKLFFEASENAKRYIELISSCDHQFTGSRNGKMLSSSFLWAFTDILDFPGHSKGIKLY